MATNQPEAVICENDPNFAVITSYILQFGPLLSVTFSISDLKQMLEDTERLHEELVDLHIRLLRKRRKYINKDKWEKALVKFVYEYSNVEAWELERYGYKHVKLSIRLEVIKPYEKMWRAVYFKTILQRLLEAQFDCNAKFKSEVNGLDANLLRLLPIGKDVNGNQYWYQLDMDYNFRIYKEVPEEENSWAMICNDRETLHQLISDLETKTVVAVKEESSATVSENDDSNLTRDAPGLTPVKLEKLNFKEIAKKEDDDPSQNPLASLTIKCNGSITPEEAVNLTKGDTSDSNHESITLKVECTESVQVPTIASKEESCAVIDINVPVNKVIESSDFLLQDVKCCLADLLDELENVLAERNAEDLRASPAESEKSHKESQELPEQRCATDDLSDQHQAVLKVPETNSTVVKDDVDVEPSVPKKLCEDPVESEILTNKVDEALKDIDQPSIELPPEVSLTTEDISVKSKEDLVQDDLMHEDDVESVVKDLGVFLVDQVCTQIEYQDCEVDTCTRKTRRGGRGRGRSRGRGTSRPRGRGRGCGGSSTPAPKVEEREPSPPPEPLPVKRSSRIQALQEKKNAQLAEQMRQEQLRLESMVKKRSEQEQKRQDQRVKKQVKSESEYSQSEPNSDDSDNDKLQKKRKRRKKGKHGKFPWDSQSSSSESSDEASEEVEEEEEEEEVLKFDDHEDEFACEEMEPDAEPVVMKRARTVKKVRSDTEPSDDSEEEENDDTPCRRCGKYDHPEWILLCDKCDEGYHTACLRPPLMIIPDGDWFCPPCENKSLLERLQEEYENLGKLLEKREREVLRQERLKFAAMSVNSILTHPKPERRVSTDSQGNVKLTVEVKEKRISDDESEEEAEENEDDSRDGSEDEIDDCFKLRSARNKKINYQFKEYDELINSAIRGEDFEEDGYVYTKEEDHVENQVTVEVQGCEIKPVVTLETTENVAEVTDLVVTKTEIEECGQDEEEQAINRRSRARPTRKRRLNDLDSPPEDDDSDESFKGTSDTEVEDPSEEEEEMLADSATEEESDDSVWKASRRKNTRNGKSSSSKKGSGSKRKKGYRRDGFVVDSEDSDGYGGSLKVRTRSKRKNVSYKEISSDETEEEQSWCWKTSKSAKRKAKSESSEEEWDSDSDEKGKKGRVKATKKFREESEDDEEEDDDEEEEEGDEDENEDEPEDNKVEEEEEDEDEVDDDDDDDEEEVVKASRSKSKAKSAVKAKPKPKPKPKAKPKPKSKPKPKAKPTPKKMEMRGKPRLSKARMMNLNEDSDDDDNKENANEDDANNSHSEPEDEDEDINLKQNEQSPELPAEASAMATSSVNTTIPPTTVPSEMPSVPPPLAAATTSAASATLAPVHLPPLIPMNMPPNHPGAAAAPHMNISNSPVQIPVAPTSQSQAHPHQHHQQQHPPPPQQQQHHQQAQRCEPSALSQLTAFASRGPVTSSGMSQHQQAQPPPHYNFPVNQPPPPPPPPLIHGPLDESDSYSITSLDNYTGSRQKALKPSMTTESYPPQPSSPSRLLNLEGNYRQTGSPSRLMDLNRFHQPTLSAPITTSSSSSSPHLNNFDKRATMVSMGHQLPPPRPPYGPLQGGPLPPPHGHPGPHPLQGGPPRDFGNRPQYPVHHHGGRGPPPDFPPGTHPRAYYDPRFARPGHMPPGPPQGAHHARGPPPPYRHGPPPPNVAYFQAAHQQSRFYPPPSHQNPEIRGSLPSNSNYPSHALPPHHPPHMPPQQGIPTNHYGYYGPPGGLTPNGGFMIQNLLQTQRANAGNNGGDNSNGNGNRMADGPPVGRNNTDTNQGLSTGIPPVASSTAATNPTPSHASPSSRGPSSTPERRTPNDTGPNNPNSEVGELKNVADIVSFITQE